MHVSAVLVGCGLLLPSAHAWGSLGHRAVAYLAEMYLDDRAKAMVQTFLANEPADDWHHGWDISDAAVWADELRNDTSYDYLKPWHFIDANDSPPENCNVDYERDCQSDGKPGCAVSAIARMARNLMDDTYTTSEDGDGDGDGDGAVNATEAAKAFNLLIHFIGDLHQPLHTESMSRGGNGIYVCFAGECKYEFNGRNYSVNLHSVWDTCIPQKINGRKCKNEDRAGEKLTARAWAARLFLRPDHRTDAAAHHHHHHHCHGLHGLHDAKHCAVHWARESNALICSAVLRPGLDWLRQNDLADGDYFANATRAVDDQVAAAGRRIGAWLNALAAYRADKILAVQEL